ncbi:hypothetical protein PVIIG_00571 [Plasmodium vivax India VII]|uniref:Clu domain-containing protein n=1 Tax=Plasmodium vivax India VII TaxID=1077284 RepID=A0A0J9S532_PLAVI|nr:hypothetical protein PVIIG_00571 [Plasmodium vivax India VII]
MGMLKRTFSSSNRKKRQRSRGNKQAGHQSDSGFKALEDYLIDHAQFDRSGGAAGGVVGGAVGSVVGGAVGTRQNGANWGSKHSALSGKGANAKPASAKSKSGQQLARREVKKKGNLKRIIRNTLCLFKSPNLRNLIFKEAKVTEPEKKILNIKFVVNEEPTESRPQSVLTHKKSIEVSKFAESKKQIVTKNAKIIPVKKPSQAVIDKPVSKKIELKEEISEGNSQTSESSLPCSEPFEKCYKVEINKSRVPRLQELFGQMRKGSDSTGVAGEAAGGKADKRVGRCNMLGGSSESGESSASGESSKSGESSEKCKRRGRCPPLGEEAQANDPTGCKTNVFNNLLQSVKPCRSYNIDVGHPLYNFLCKSEDSFLSSNWHDRINYAFRNIWALKEYMHDDKSEGEREKEFYNELELFHMASKIGACGLIYSLFFRKQELKNDSISYFKKCFVQVSKENYPHIYKIYKPKFDDDLVFLFDSLVFTVILGSRRNGVNYNMARKIYSNDMKGKNVLCDCIFALKNGSKFALPVASQIDFMGMRVISEPLMPLSEAHPPVDVIKDIFRGFTFSNYMSDGGGSEGATENGHLTGKQTMKKTPQNEGKNLPKEEKHLKRKKEKMFYERLLLEMENYDHELYQQIKQMGDSVNYHCCILPFGFSNYYECKVFKKRNNVKLFKSLIDNLFVVRGAEEVLPPYVDNSAGGNFTKRIRYEFIKNFYPHSLSNTTLNIDVKNYEYKKCKNNVDLLKDASRECLHNIHNYILPKVVSIVANFSDSFDITQVYHSHGVNMHHLGRLLSTDRDTAPPEFLSQTICREIICRTLKSIYYEHIHSFLLGVLGRGKRGSSGSCKGGNHRWFDNAHSVSPFSNEEHTHHYDRVRGGTPEQCNQFICFCEKCFTEWDYFPEVVPHKFLIRLANLTLNVRAVDSVQFWHQVLIPECMKKFKVNLKDHINIKEVEVYGLLVCMEYHLGVYFNKECKRNYKVRLPLTLEDMCAFGSKKESVLFPNVAHLRAVCEWGGASEMGEVSEAVNEVVNEVVSDLESNVEREYPSYHCDDEPSAATPHGYALQTVRSNSREKRRGYNYKSPYRSVTSGAKNNAQKSYKTSGGTASGGLKGNPTWEKGATTSNYDDSSSPSTSGSSKVGHNNVYTLVDKMRKKKWLSRGGSTLAGGKQKRELTPSVSVHSRIREDPPSRVPPRSNFQRSNIALFYPKTKGCFPKYATWSFRTVEKLISSNVMMQEKFKVKNMLRENIVNIIHPKRSDFLQMSNICTVGSCNKIRSFMHEYNVPCHPYCILNEKMKCINYVRAKKCIYLLLNVGLNKNIFELSKRFLCLAYLHFEHGYVKKCLDVCYYIYGVIPNIGTVRRDILALILQCKVKEGNIDDALIIYKLIVIFNKFYEGHGNSLHTLICNVLMASYYYDRANERTGRGTRGEGICESNIYDNDICDDEWEDHLGKVPRAECRNHNRGDHQTGEATTSKGCAKKKLMLDQVDHLELKKKYLLKALHYSEESYRAISTTLCDVSTHYVCIYALILQGNILMGLHKFQSAIKYYTISLQNCERAKLPNFVTLQNKCLLADSLKNNGNYDKAIEIAEECLKALSSCTQSSRSLTLYVIFRLAEMKQYIGCRDLIYPNIFLDNISNAHIKKKITCSDFLIFEKNYLNEKNKKFRKEAIDLYIILYDKLRSQKNYNLVFAKDIFGCYYTKGELSYCRGGKGGMPGDATRGDTMQADTMQEDTMQEDEMEKIFLVIREILKIKVISLSMKKQFMLASKLLGIVLTKNSSPFVRELTLLKRGAEKNRLYGKSHPDECTSTGVQPSEAKREDHLGSTARYPNNDLYIADLLSDVHTNGEQKYTKQTLHFQLGDFHQSRQSNFFHRSCYTREYDYISIEKLLFDDTYFVIDDICKWCYSKCDAYNSKQNVGAETDAAYLLNPSIWFDLLFFSVMKGTCSHTELLILIDLVKFFLTPLQKQLILFRVKSLSSISGNEQYSEYIQHLLDNEGKEILRVMNILDKEKNSGNLCVGAHPELSNLHKKDVMKNVDFLSNIIVTNPWLMSPSNTFDSAR